MQSRFQLRNVDVNSMFSKLKDGKLNSLTLSDLKSISESSKEKQNIGSKDFQVSKYEIDVNPTTAKRCFYCMRKFSKIRAISDKELIILGIPLKVDGDTFYCVDAICSLNCCISYTDEHFTDNEVRNQIMRNIARLTKLMFPDRTEPIRRAPNPRALIENGGKLDYKKYEELYEIGYIWTTQIKETEKIVKICHYGKTISGKNS